MAGAGGVSPEGAAVLAAARFPDLAVVVALGGGADSAVCAWAAVAAGRAVRAATVDHGLPASPALIAAAREAAARLGLDHRLLPAPARGESEASLRAARYSALEADAGPEEAIATGHTRDDQAETVLANLLRGAGAAGLAGIPARRGRWCRPLLALSREEVRAAADSLGLPYADDPGNLDPARQRNLLRHQVLPLLEERAGPGVGAALARAASLLAADDAELERRAAAVPLRRSGGVVRLPAAALATLPPPVAGRAARRGLRMILDPYPGHAPDVEAVLAVAAGKQGTAGSLQGGFLVVREGPWVLLAVAGPPPSVPETALPVPGEAAYGAWVLRADGPLPMPRLRPVGRRQALVDAGVAGGEPTVRGALPGDRVEVRGGGKPVAEALREAGVPATARQGWPVVCAGGRIAWVAGVRVASWAAPRGGLVVRLVLREAQ